MYAAPGTNATWQEAASKALQLWDSVNPYIIWTIITHDSKMYVWSDPGSLLTVLVNDYMA